MQARALVVKAYSSYADVVLLADLGDLKAGALLPRVRLRGRLRQQARSVLTGDKVIVAVRRSGVKSAVVIEAVEPRTTELYRPPVANVDQVILVFTLVQPEFNWALLDRQLVLAEAEELGVVLCLNKADLVEPEQIDPIVSVYRQIGYPVLVTSAKTGQGIDALEQALSHHISVFAGQSGVGKSRLLNSLNPEFRLQTGAVSAKIGRGRHTTRYVQLLPLGDQGWVADSPGFNYLELQHLSKEELPFCFPEFRRLQTSCRFTNCLHHQEPGCAVKQALEQGDIHPQRYANYLDMLEELRQWEENQYR